VISAALFGFISTRCKQARDAGVDEEEAIRALEGSPSPRDIAVIRSILPAFAKSLKVDLSRPLGDLSEQEMIEMLLSAWLMANANSALENDPAQKILRKREGENGFVNEAIPF
jgi:hypothetical protein